MVRAKNFQRCKSILTQIINVYVQFISTTTIPPKSFLVGGKFERNTGNFVLRLKCVLSGSGRMKLLTLKNSRSSGVKSWTFS